MKSAILLFLSVLVGANTLQSGERVTGVSAGPGEAARSFYGELRRLRVTGLPTGASWSALAPRMTEELAAAFQRARAEQADFIKKHPDEKPPWIEGDLFSSLFEGPLAFEIGEAAVKGDRAEVPVVCTHAEGGKSTKWTDRIMLRKSIKGWFIDDVRYGGTWDFANTGTLRAALAPEGR